MSEIKIMEKPEWISYDEIHDILYVAHESNREKGVNVETAVMSGKELEEHIGTKGKTYVALDGDKLVGTVSYRIINRNYWCAKGEVASIVLLGVIPEYKGRHISPLLTAKAKEEIKANGYMYIEAQTQEENEIVQKMALKNGYRYIDFYALKNIDHYTVVMLKWLDECPYSMKQTERYYRKKRFFTKLRYKRGKIKRFGI